MNDPTIILAFDRTLNNREIDADGRMHVKVSRISKANVCPYKGSEIPDYEALGLDPERIYQLYRDPGELAKGASTFNNIQLLRRHIAVSADDPKKDDVVGTTGETAEFRDPYLYNSLAIWDAEAIAGIESRDQCEISCSYRYKAVMEPGETQGVAFDGRMTEIVANHVALVEAGRAGSDVLVGDSKLGMSQMTALKSRKALMVKGALAAYVSPRLATGQTLAYDSILGAVNRANFKTAKAGILAAIKPKLANDADMEDIHKLLDSLDDENDGAEDEVAEDEDDPDEKDRETAEDEAGYCDMNAKDRKAWDAKWAKDRPARDAARKARDEMDEETRKADDRMRAAKDRKRAKDKAKDAEIDGKEKTEGAVDQKAMDAALKTVEATTIARMQAIREAERAVEPFTGPIVVAMDSAEAVYKFGLDTLKIDVTDVHPSAYGAIIRLQPKPGVVTPRLAMDSGNVSDLFPDAARIRQA